LELIKELYYDARPNKSQDIPYLFVNGSCNDPVTVYTMQNVPYEE